MENPHELFISMKEYALYIPSVKIILLFLSLEFSSINDIDTVWSIFPAYTVLDCEQCLIFLCKVTLRVPYCNVIVRNCAD